MWSHCLLMCFVGLSCCNLIQSISFADQNGQPSLNNYNYKARARRSVHILDYPSNVDEQDRQDRQDAVVGESTKNTESHQGSKLIPPTNSPSSILLKSSGERRLYYPQPPHVNFYSGVGEMIDDINPGPGFNRNGMTPAAAAGAHNEILSKDELSPFLLQALQDEEEQEQELKRLYPNNRVIPPYSWEAKQHGKSPMKVSNHPNGLRSSSPPLTNMNTNTMDWIVHNGPAAATAAAGVRVQSNENYNFQQGWLGEGDSMSRSRNSLRSASHEPLGTTSSQWNKRLRSSRPLFLTDKMAKRNANYMCHFKLCQLGASGKRRLNPTKWLFNDSEYDYNENK